MVTSTHKTIPTGYKQTEVGVIPSDWGVETLGPHVEIKSGESPSLFSFEDFGTPYFKVDQLNNNNKYLKDTPYFFHGEKKVIRGSLIFPKRGASIMLNKVRILKEDSFMDTNLMTLTPKSPLNNEYLYYALTYVQLWKIADTTSIPQINNKHINPLKVAIPPKREQTSIATVLSDADSLIESLEQIIAKKHAIKQGAMQELLTGKRRLPGFSEEWEEKKLGDLLNYEQPTKYLVKSTEYRENNKTPVLTAGKTFILGHTDEEFGIFTDLPTIIFDDFTTDTKYVEFPFKAKSSAMKMLKPRDSEINLRFLFEKMQLINFKPGTHKRYWIAEYRHLEIDVPTPEEQTAIAGVLSDMDSEIDALELRLGKYKALKQGMMQLLLTGKIRLPH